MISNIHSNGQFKKLLINPNDRSSFRKHKKKIKKHPFFNIKSNIFNKKTNHRYIPMIGSLIRTQQLNTAFISSYRQTF